MDRHTFNRTLLRGLCALAAGVAVAGCYDSGFGQPEREENDMAVTETIAGLQERFVGKPFTVTGDIVVAGTVTTSDEAGNFYRTLCIEQGQAALEIMAGIDRLHNDYPPGCRVTLRLKGLTVARSRGVLQVGTAPEPGSGYDTDYIGSRAALDRHLIRNGEALQEPVPTQRSIPGLEPAMCGTLVRIGPLSYCPEEDAEEPETGWSGYRRFADREGHTIYTYVRSYATFTDEEIPAAEVALIGILQYDDTGEGRFLLKLRDESDCIPLD